MSVPCSEITCKFDYREVGAGGWLSRDLIKELLKCDESVVAGKSIQGSVFDTTKLRWETR